MSNIHEWSPTAGLNVASPPNGWPEGMARSAVNDTAREMMAAIARFYLDTNGQLVSAGTDTALTLTTNTGYTALGDINRLTFKAHTVNDGPITLSVDGLAAKSIKARDGTALFIGDIRAGQMVTVIWNDDADRFELQNEIGDRPGTVKSWAGATEPPGWIFAYGQDELRADYPYLFGVIGETYGPGDGSTTFGLPDLRGRVVAYRDDMGGVDAGRLDSMDSTVLGDGGGDQLGLASTEVELETSHLPSHTHGAGSFAAAPHTHGPGTLFGTTNSDGSHSHSYTAPNAAVATYDSPGGAAAVPSTAGTSTGAAGTHTHAFGVTGGATAASALAAVSGTSGSTGSGDTIDIEMDVSTVQPTIILNGIIKT